MSNEEMRLTCSYWCKFLMTYHGRYNAATLPEIERDAENILKQYSSPLSVDLMNAVMSELERSMKQ